MTSSPKNKSHRAKKPPSLAAFYFKPFVLIRTHQFDLEAYSRLMLGLKRRGWEEVLVNQAGKGTMLSGQPLRNFLPRWGWLNPASPDYPMSQAGLGLDGGGATGPSPI